jgi:hypothetical protein
MTDSNQAKFTKYRVVDNRKKQLKERAASSTYKVWRSVCVGPSPRGGRNMSELFPRPMVEMPLVVLEPMS